MRWASAAESGDKVRVESHETDMPARDHLEESPESSTPQPSLQFAQCRTVPPYTGIVFQSLESSRDQRNRGGATHVPVRSQPSANGGFKWPQQSTIGSG